MDKASFICALAASTLIGFYPPLAKSDDSMPKRGTTYTTEHDVSRIGLHSRSKRIEIHILRGTEPNNQGPVPIAEPPPPKPEPKWKKVRHRRHRDTVPDN